MPARLHKRRNAEECLAGVSRVMKDTIADHDVHTPKTDARPEQVHLKEANPAQLVLASESRRQPERGKSHVRGIHLGHAHRGEIIAELTRSAPNLQHLRSDRNLFCEKAREHTLTGPSRQGANVVQIVVVRKRSFGVKTLNGRRDLPTVVIDIQLWNVVIDGIDIPSIVSLQRSTGVDQLVTGHWTDEVRIEICCG